MQMVGAFAEFERAMLKERTKAGLDAARKEGRIGGRPPKLKPHQQAEQDRISWVERELDRIAAAIREVREYIERAREWAREQAQARRAAGVARTRHPLDSYK